MTKFKAFADNKKKSTYNEDFCLLTGLKHYGKEEKCWLPSFPPFPIMFSKGFRYMDNKRCDFQTDKKNKCESITKTCI